MFLLRRPTHIKVCATNSQASGLLAWPKQWIQAMCVGRDVAAFRDVVVLRAVVIVLPEIPSNAHETMSGSIKFCTCLIESNFTQLTLASTFTCSVAGS